MKRGSSYSLYLDGPLLYLSLANCIWGCNSVFSVHEHEIKGFVTCSTCIRWTDKRELDIMGNPGCVCMQVGQWLQ